MYLCLGEIYENQLHILAGRGVKETGTTNLELELVHDVQVMTITNDNCCTNSTDEYLSGTDTDTPGYRCSNITANMMCTSNEGT